MKLIAYLFISLILTSCERTISYIGKLPENISSLQDKNLEDIKKKYIVAQDLDDPSKYYIGFFKYETVKGLGSTNLLESKVYALETLDNKVKNITELKASKDLPARSVKMPTSPERLSLISQLFNDVGSIRMF